MKNAEKKYPVAEMFTSPQGEGLYTGVLMTFMRFAGCSVGKKMNVAQREEWAAKVPEFAGALGRPKSGFELLPLREYTELCTTYDGRNFCCDTDFRTKEVLTVAELVGRIPEGVGHVCITGGEPLDQPLTPLLEELASNGLAVHIETSGTVSITERAFPNYSWGDSLETAEGWLWVTVAPKLGVLPEMIGLANEIKLLVDEDFDVAKIPEDILDHRLVWISAINFENSIDEKNMAKCLQLLQEHPNWRLALQAQKVWRVR
jgi:organic radical activating enzyme